MGSTKHRSLIVPRDQTQQSQTKPDTNSLADVTRLDGLLKWVVDDLNASTARWKIVYGHHPLAGVPDKPENPGGNYSSRGGK